MTLEELKKLPLYCLGITATIPLGATATIPKWTPGSPLDYKAVLCALLGLSPKTATMEALHLAAEEYFKQKHGKSVYALSAWAGMMSKEATSERLRQALGISEEDWNKYIPEEANELQSLSANGSMTEEEATAAKVRKALGISDKEWNNHTS